MERSQRTGRRARRANAAIDAMQFSTRKRRQPPTVIIVSLIDVLIVVLIFLMVTTTSSNCPPSNWRCPNPNKPKAGATENAARSSPFPKQGPLYLKTDPVTMERCSSG